MADDKKVAKAEQGEKKPGNKLMLVVIILLVLLLAAVGGLAFYMFTNAHQQAAGQEAAHQEKAPKKDKDAPPVFAKLETFVVNLSGDGGSLLQVDMQAELADEAAKKRFEEYMPKIRSGLILLLSSKTPEELSSPDGKVKLKAQVKKIINEAMEAGEDEPVESVQFTSFIIQNQ
ncbi:flagellar basal body-associated protein FliL [Gulbenkiania mobilis]|uniref:Flagellar protein FliL n=1 Tax=Gulbenkiania mobilis TaxID=397457 RepID=A0ABY2D0T7_GULMO|nr:flagellar FliL protein [Gulbenkiania mobilis]